MVEIAQTQGRTKHVLLALEVALVVVPVTIVGGFYVVLGLLGGAVSLIMSVQHQSLSGWWLGVFALALGGLAGIVGLWLLVLIAVRETTPTMRARAFAASIVGAVTAVIALVLAERGGTTPHWWIVYLLVSPIIVVCHRALADSRLSSSSDVR